MDSIIDQLKKHVTDDVFKAQQIIASNMHLLESIHSVECEELEDIYADIMTGLDKLIQKVGDI
jgi:hypothetical protein